jgi:hypothetical protein
MSAIHHPARAYPATDRARPELRIIKGDFKAAQRRRRMDDLFLAVMIACMSVFAIALFGYVLWPATSTVTRATARSSSSGRR